MLQDKGSRQNGAGVPKGHPGKKTRERKGDFLSTYYVVYIGQGSDRISLNVFFCKCLC
jgi:hypothetical protein